MLVFPWWKFLSLVLSRKFQPNLCSRSASNKKKSIFLCNAKKKNWDVIMCVWHCSRNACKLIISWQKGGQWPKKKVSFKYHTLLCMYTIFSFKFFFSFWYHWLEKCFPKTLQARLLEQPILGTKFVRKLLIFEYLGGKNSKLCLKPSAQTTTKVLKRPSLPFFNAHTFWSLCEIADNSQTKTLLELLYN